MRERDYDDKNRLAIASFYSAYKNRSNSIANEEKLESMADYINYFKNIKGKEFASLDMYIAPTLPECWKTVDTDSKTSEEHYYVVYQPPNIKNEPKHIRIDKDLAPYCRAFFETWKNQMTINSDIMTAFGPVGIGMFVAKLPDGFLCDKGYEVIEKFLPAMFAGQYNLMCTQAFREGDKNSYNKLLERSTIIRTADSTTGMLAMALAAREREEAKEKAMKSGDSKRSEKFDEIDIEGVVGDSFSMPIRGSLYNKREMV